MNVRLPRNELECDTICNIKIGMSNFEEITRIEVAGIFQNDRWAPVPEVNKTL